MTRYRNPALVIGAVLVIAMILMVSCTRKYEFPAISRDQIPQAVLDLTDGFVPKGVSLDDLGFVWRVCAPKDGRLMVAGTFYEGGNRNKPGNVLHTLTFGNILAGSRP